MAAVCGLRNAPVFCPIVAPYYAGMEVTVPLTADDTSASPDEIREVYRAYYTSGASATVSLVAAPAAGAR